MGLYSRLLWILLGLSRSQIQLVSDCLIGLNREMPSDFARQPRSLLDLDRWKATEFCCTQDLWCCEVSSPIRCILIFWSYQQQCPFSWMNVIGGESFTCHTKNSFCIFFVRKAFTSRPWRWKATEFRQFLLYTEPVVLRGVLTNQMYTNFYFLSTVMAILLDECDRRTICHTQNSFWIFFVRKVFTSRPWTMEGDRV